MALTAAIGLGLVLAPGAPNPSAGLASHDLIAEGAVAALAALDALSADVEDALDGARIASASVVSGDDRPTTHIDDAAGLAVAAEEVVPPVRSGVNDLAAVASAADPGVAPPPQPVAAGELASIGAQLRASVEAADRFFVIRRQATGLPGVLDRALAALDDGSLDEARTLVADARADHGAVVAWDSDQPTLPVWIETTDAMISGVEDIVEALEAGDAAAAERAGEDVFALADEAAQADRALRIALGEGGAGLLGPPLERLAATLRGIEATRSAIMELVRS
ncbi:MAG: hypothetical protein ABIQ23_03380 [Candidatus Limnocylindria bacterium]